jgi:hypothetical protein
VPQATTFQGSTINPFDISGAMQQNYQQQMANYQNKLSGIFGIGKTLLGMTPWGAAANAAGGVAKGLFA